MDSRTASGVALMSIHPGFATALMDGTKRVEFRRVVPKLPISHVIVYATMPVGAIVGAVEVAELDSATPKELWSRYHRVGGIQRDAFFRYFKGRSLGTALVVKKVLRCAKPFALDGSLFPVRPPQSFMYLDRAALEVVVASVGHTPIAGDRRRTLSRREKPEQQAQLSH